MLAEPPEINSGGSFYLQQGRKEVMEKEGLPMQAAMLGVWLGLQTR
jgi:hypothetical protein